MVIAFFEAANHGTIGVKTNNEDPATTYEQVTAKNIEPYEIRNIEYICALH